MYNKIIIIKNAKQVLTIKGKDLGIIENSTIIIRGNKISKIIPNSKSRIPNSHTIDANGCIILPGFVDCHTHLVFAGSRENEFAMRLNPAPIDKTSGDKTQSIRKVIAQPDNRCRGKGKTYKEILKAGVGILQTVQATRKASEKELFNLAQKRIDDLVRWGTTTVEIKSGYGLDTASELKILRVINQLKKANKDKITIVPTFLGAHAIPFNTSKTTYIKKIISEMIPRVAKENSAVYCDVFCENFVFNAKESKTILQSAMKFGLIPKIHADEIESSGGAEVAGEVGAISAEHLLYPSDKGLKAMEKRDVVCVLLPGTTLFLGSNVSEVGAGFSLRNKKTQPKGCGYHLNIPPVEKMRKLGLTIALGSDFNPGTCMIYQMPIIISLGCLLYNLSITEAIRAVTINGAKALGLDNYIGSIEVGKNADILILDIPDYKHIPYQFGKNLIKTVIKKGKVIYSRKIRG